MSSIIDSIERSQLKANLPTFGAGDRVRVHFQVIEGTRKRTQVFEGVVLKRQGSGSRETFTVRKQSFGVGVERTFPLHSAKIERLEVAARGDVRRAKLYYLRGRVGKRARVSERRWGIDEEVFATAPEEVEAVDSEGVAQSEAEVVEAPEDEAEQDAGVAEETQQPEVGQSDDAGTEEQPPAEDEAEPEGPTEPDEAGESEEPEQLEGEKDES